MRALPLPSDTGAWKDKAIELPLIPALTLLSISAISNICVGAVAVGQVRDELTATEAKLHTWTWQIQQLVPDEVHDESGVGVVAVGLSPVAACHE